jgi:uncharacterized membrane protein YhaH (DUF805 family)
MTSKSVNVKASPVWHYSISGRYGRNNFINAFFALFLVSIILYMLLEHLVPSILTILYFIFIFFYIRAVILRIHDMDKSAKWAIPVAIIYTVYIPNLFIENMNFYYLFLGVSVVIHSLLCLVPGTKGENKYGQDTISGHHLGLILTILLFIAVLLIYTFTEIIVPPAI